MENNPLTGLLGLLMLLQLAVVLMILLGGLYALYCLNRAASGLDRLASAVESWVVQAAKAQARIEASKPTQPLAPISGPNADWLQPIELLHTVPASNEPSVTATANASTANPLSARPDSEGEVRRD
jgi:hypothetical protein